MSHQRADQAVQKLFSKLTRSKVQSLIEKGKVEILGSQGQWQKIKKPGEKLSQGSLSVHNIRILPDDELNYVSRGALKLKGAFQKFSQVPIEHKTWLDMGLSTGGFSDYLLQAGASKILGLDVGTGQLHHSLRCNSRLYFFDKVNCRHPIPPEILNSFFGKEIQKFDGVVIDISFISISQVIPQVRSLLGGGGFCVALVKPQFEVERSDLNKKGVLKNVALIDEVVRKITRVFNDNRLHVIDTCPS